MSEIFDFIVVGAGSAGAVIAARLSEDPACRVALVEAGERPPEVELMPVACAAMQRNPATDWMYTADPGKAGLGLKGRRVPVPRGKMLGGSSGLNYMAYVRGHPGDFDCWADKGARGWGYADVLPYFRKSEGLAPSGEIVIDAEAHNTSGPLGVSVRSPVLSGACEFVEAAVAAGIPRGDYNGRERGGPAGLVSLLQTNTRHGKRSSTYRAFLEGDAERRPNLTILTGAQSTRVILEGSPGQMAAKGVEYRTVAGEVRTAIANKEVILSAGAVGSPHLLMLSGIGPRPELEAAGVRCLVDSPHVGKHLKDHLQVPLFFPAPGAGVSMGEVLLSMGPDALRQPAGPLPANPGEDANLPADLRALKQEAERRLAVWQTTGRGLVSSSLYDAAAWYSTGLGDLHSHDAQIVCFASGGSEDLFSCLNVDTNQYFDDAAERLARDAESILVLANPVLPHSEGEIVLESADPAAHPAIRMNYFGDPHDMKVMIAVLRRALDIVAHWPAHRRVGPLMVPPLLARKHGHRDGATPSDALLQDFALHFSLTVYHLACTCRIGGVVDPRLRVAGVAKLRVADASAMPNVVSGNTNAASIMIGEKAAEMVAADHGVKLAGFVGEHAPRRP
ncbi:MAG TPA: GMC family oxidoreductase N-terminal domain-containing protein [Candidatus Acidoferrales bacterium]|nr:GMC family oxidoreductase N-terminal domain-containing protein [Candidatus Acidoferrales bacterium]